MRIMIILATVFYVVIFLGTLFKHIKHIKHLEQHSVQTKHSRSLQGGYLISIWAWDYLNFSFLSLFIFEMLIMEVFTS